MNKITLKIVAGLSLVLACTGCGITAASLKHDPGYASLNYPWFWEADKEVSISLGPTVLGFARMFIDDEEEFSQLIAHVRGIHLRVYSVQDNIETMNNYVDESAQDLNEHGWEQVVSSHDNGEYAVIMMKMADEEIQGLVVLSTDDEEAVFINVIGNIEPKSLQPLIAGVYDHGPAITTEL